MINFHLISNPTVNSSTSRFVYARAAKDHRQCARWDQQASMDHLRWWRRPGMGRKFEFGSWRQQIAYIAEWWTFVIAAECACHVRSARFEIRHVGHGVALRYGLVLRRCSVHRNDLWKLFGTFAQYPIGRCRWGLHRNDQPGRKGRWSVAMPRGKWLKNKFF